jgi:Cof subfamily protein (haloacid dehalogenase superfamily)
MVRFRLVAIDLDGTLLDSRRTIPSANHRALERAHREGIRLAVVTGRRWLTARPYVSQLRVDPLLVLNGGALVRRGLKGPVLRQTPIALEVGRQVLALARKMKVTPVVHEGGGDDGQLFVESGLSLSRPLQLYLEKTTPPPHHVLDLAAKLQRDPLQILFAGPIFEMQATARALEEQLASRVSVARTEYPDSDWAIVDVLAAGVDKGDALRFLVEHEGVGAGETMAIGDNWNDLGMLEAAGLGVVMANAPAELLARGFAQTGSNDAAGVAQAMERYLLGGE